MRDSSPNSSLLSFCSVLPRPSRGALLVPDSGASVRLDSRGVVTICEAGSPFIDFLGVEERRLLMAGVKGIPRGAPNQTQASTALGHLLRDHLEARNSTNSTRALRLPDGTSAAWYILTIIGIYAVVFLFRLASNILRKNDKSLEDIYYSNLTSELKKKSLQSKAATRPALTVASRAALSPRQTSPEPRRATSGTQTEVQGIP